MIMLNLKVIRKQSLSHGVEYRTFSFLRDAETLSSDSNTEIHTTWISYSITHQYLFIYIQKTTEIFIVKSRVVYDLEVDMLWLPDIGIDM